MNRFISVTMVIVMVGCFIKAGFIYQSTVMSKNAEIAYIKGQRDQARLKVQELEGKLADSVIMVDQLCMSLKTLEAEYSQKHSYKVTVTYYYPWANGINTDGEPNLTAIMTKPKPGATVAVSRDLRHLLGKYVYIPEVGVCKVEDLMNSKYSMRIDVCAPSLKYAKNQGIRHDVEMVLLPTYKGKEAV